MAEQLLSTTWYRVAALQPRLRTHARLHRMRYRGELWYLLQDPVNARVHRFAPVLAAQQHRALAADPQELRELGRPIEAG